MPIIVPVEDNQVGIAGLTNAKFKAADYSGSGLEALGAGLAKLGDGGQQLATALDKKRKRPRGATAQEDGDVQVTAALGDDHQHNLDDAAAKKAYVAFSDAAGPLLYGDHGILAREGTDADAAFPHVAAGLADAYDAALAPLSPEQRGNVAPALADRLQNYIALSGKHVREQGALEQHRQSGVFQQTALRDAVAHAGNADLHELYVQTGDNAIVRQGMIRGLPDSEIARQRSDYRSGAHADGIDTLVPQDAVHAAAAYARLRDGMSPATRARAEAALAPALAQQQAIADVDGLALTGAATAPVTPLGDPAVLRDKMRVIAPMMDGKVLPDLMRRYHGDAARAWAASEAGPDFIDRLIKQRGDGWYAALPDDTQRFVAHNMALLGAVGSSRAAPQDVAAATARIAAQDWNDARKAGAMRELRYRGARAEQARHDGESAATDQAFATAEKLGTEFTSIAQIDPATRRALPAGIVAVLERQADANVHPQPVAPEGPVAQQLRMLATGAPGQFAGVDLRQHRDQISPEEYDALQRLQQGVSPNEAILFSPDAAVDAHALDQGMASSTPPMDGGMIPVSFRRVRAPVPVQRGQQRIGPAQLMPAPPPPPPLPDAPVPEPRVSHDAGAFAEEQFRKLSDKPASPLFEPIRSGRVGTDMVLAAKVGGDKIGRLTGHDVIATPAMRAAAAAQIEKVRVRQGDEEIMAFGYRMPDGTIEVRPVPAGKGVGATDDGDFRHAKPSGPGRAIFVIHGHIERRRSGSRSPSDGMVDNLGIGAGKGDADGLTYDLPVATVYNGYIGWHEMKNGQLLFTVPDGAQTPAQLQAIEQNLAEQQKRFYKKH